MSQKKFTNEDSFTSSDSEDFREIFYSSSSHDRSSVGSIPWAEDAIKQNQQEWDHVEKMFYGEEDLPEEPCLRNEILEWSKAFPHLRVNGRKIDTSKNFLVQGNLFTPDIKKEEIILLHPLRQPNVTARRTNDIYKHSAKSIGQNKFDLTALNNYLEKDLRISSVPMISRRSHNIPKITTAHIISRPIIADTSKRSSHFRDILASKSSGSLLLQRKNLVPNEKSSNSATIFRMPPILILPSHVQEKHTSATIKRNQKTTIILPPIRVNRVEFDVNDAAKSATVTNQKSKMSILPMSASKVKFSK